MPRQPHEHWSITAIIVLVFLLEQLRDRGVNFLVVVFRGREHPAGFAGAAFSEVRETPVHVEEVATGSRRSGECSKAPVVGGHRGGAGGAGSVAAPGGALDLAGKKVVGGVGGCGFEGGSCACGEAEEGFG